MQKKSEDYPIQEAQRLANTPAGQQLLTMLRQENGDQLQKIMELARSGDIAGAGNALQSILSSPNARSLLKQMEDQSHG